MTTTPDENALNRLFDDAAADRPSAALMARVIADAQTTAQIKRPVSPRAHRSWWRLGIGIITRRPTLAGAIAAGVAGLTIGFYTPERIDAWSNGMLLNLVGESSIMVPNIGALGLGENDV